MEVGGWRFEVGGWRFEVGPLEVPCRNTVCTITRYGPDESTGAVGWSKDVTPAEAANFPSWARLSRSPPLARRCGGKGSLVDLLDMGLNAIPFVGVAKNTAEIVRGRDFVRDKA